MKIAEKTGCVERIAAAAAAGAVWRGGYTPPWFCYTIGNSA
ncbi:MAG: hypothetical protein ACYCO5_14700 [Acidobacteriaceae bacterium]